jgi:alpha,alpha-trehalase
MMTDVKLPRSAKSQKPSHSFSENLDMFKFQTNGNGFVRNRTVLRPAANRTHPSGNRHRSDGRATTCFEIRGSFLNSDAIQRAIQIPYLPPEAHGVIGDRRTAALVAADGTLDWLCLPDYDGDIVFGAALDFARGGGWKFGPLSKISGQQDYFENTAVLVTRWELPTAKLELIDFMPGPEDKRRAQPEPARVIIRRLRVMRGIARCCCDITPKFNFESRTTAKRVGKNLVRFKTHRAEFHIWSNCSMDVSSNNLFRDFNLSTGREIWVVLEFAATPSEWSVARAKELLATTKRYWREWNTRLVCHGSKTKQIRRSAQTVHLLSYAPDGSIVAAPTTSFPARIGGDWNADYRFSWIRDASLSLAVLGLIGNSEDARRYFDWLTSLDSPTGEPLQVLYGIHSERKLTQREICPASGHRESPPVRVGNHAYRQRQLGSYGYLADCALIYLAEGHEWKPEYSELIRRIADHTATHWHLKGNGIWELSVQQHYVSSKVMSWVTLDRAIKISERLGDAFDTKLWKTQMKEIKSEVMRRGWSRRLRSFKQRYEGDNLDAALLLIPIMEFLPPKHPRVLATIDRIAENLAINGFVHRFDPPKTPGVRKLPLGEFEAAFLPCTFWLASAYAKTGRVELAKKIVADAEQIAGKFGLFAEGVDTRTRSFLGNYPLLFSQVEYVRALLEIEAARGNAKKGRGRKHNAFHDAHRR